MHSLKLKINIKISNVKCHTVNWRHTGETVKINELPVTHLKSVKHLYVRTQYKSKLYKTWENFHFYHAYKRNTHARRGGVNSSDIIQHVILHCEIKEQFNIEIHTKYLQDLCLCSMCTTEGRKINNYTWISSLYTMTISRSKKYDGTFTLTDLLFSTVHARQRKVVLHAKIDPLHNILIFLATKTFR